MLAISLRAPPEAQPPVEAWKTLSKPSQVRLGRFASVVPPDRIPREEPDSAAPCTDRLRSACAKASGSRDVRAWGGVHIQRTSLPRAAIRSGKVRKNPR